MNLKENRLIRAISKLFTPGSSPATIFILRRDLIWFRWKITRGARRNLRLICYFSTRKVWWGARRSKIRLGLTTPWELDNGQILAFWALFPHLRAFQKKTHTRWQPQPYRDVAFQKWKAPQCNPNRVLWSCRRWKAAWIRTKIKRLLTVIEIVLPSRTRVLKIKISNIQALIWMLIRVPVWARGLTILRWGSSASKNFGKRKKTRTSAKWKCRNT